MSDTTNARPTLKLFSHRTNRIIDEINEIGEEGIQNSIFFNSYKDALRICNEIIVNFEEPQNKSNDDNTSNTGTKRRINGNNIVSIIGGRGVGKSSFMTNLVKLLCKNDSKSYSTFITDDDRSLGSFEWINNPSAYYFKEVSHVDPNLLEEKERLFEYIVGEMFKDLEQWLDGATKRKTTTEINNDDSFKKLLQSFQKIYDTIVKVNKARDGKPDEHENIIEALKTISASSSLEVSAISKGISPSK